MPTWLSRCAMKSGVVAVGSNPVTTRVAKTGAAAGSSTTTGYAAPSGSGVSRSAGSRKPSAPSTDTATSRAIPRRDSA